MNQFESISAGSSFSSADGLANLANVVQLGKDVRAFLKSAKPNATIGKKSPEGFAVTIVMPVKMRKEAVTIAEVLKPFAVRNKIAIAGETGKFTLAFYAADKETAEKAVTKYSRSAVVPAPIMYFTVPKRSKAVAYDAAKAKAKNPTYMKKRAIAISQRTSVSDAVTAILPVYAAGILSASLEKKVKAAADALTKHIAKSASVKSDAGDIADKNRVARGKEYTEMASEAMRLLTGAGIKETNIVLGTSIGGKTLYAKLPSGKVMTIGLSTIQNFNKAKKAAAEAFKDEELE